MSFYLLNTKRCSLNFFSGAKKGYETRRKCLMFQWPVGLSKSSIVINSCRAIKNILWLYLNWNYTYSGTYLSLHSEEGTLQKYRQLKHLQKLELLQVCGKHFCRCSWFQLCLLISLTNVIKWAVTWSSRRWPDVAKYQECWPKAFKDMGFFPPLSPRYN